MKKNRKIKPSQKSSYRYGMIKIPEGQNLIWASEQNKHGWSLGLVTKTGKIMWLKNTRFASKKAVLSMFDKRSVTFVPVKTKQIVKDLKKIN